MNNKLFLGLIWFGLLIYAFLFAPPQQPDTFELIVNLSQGNIDNINPLIVSLFYLMGILPTIYACFLFVDGQGQKLPAWIFILGSFGAGAFVLLPYLALRKDNPSWNGQKSWLIKILEAPLTGIILTIGTLYLIFIGLNNGNWSDFIQQWHNSKFIHVMSIDFCFLCLLFPVILKDDLLRRNIDNSAILGVISFVPLLGTLTYLCLRPNLEDR